MIKQIINNNTNFFFMKKNKTQNLKKSSNFATTNF